MTEYSIDTGTCTHKHMRTHSCTPTLTHSLISLHKHSPMRGFGVTYHNTYRNQCMLWVNRGSHSSCLLKREITSSIFYFVHSSNSEVAQKLGGDMPDYDSGLSQEAKLVKGVLNKHFLLCVLKPSLTFLLSFGLKSPCRTSVCRLKRTIYTLDLLSQRFSFVLHT